ncbi:UDP-glucuronic acid decarboxylase 1 [Tritrichomonas foetus]|uniref:UDP-glucuronic acid decarboxylase 1 n=1 Tax=Tritrichomonas foetus TaxID=1144522 RepID=A0A1J4KIK3_9EUKA|nr:UDP-glucuronic acid decarboxylase 1 [Tritrichomonas foetus]|eukprot:OHT10890.1 UDP-glucuronic acid decarboxylase 1 [Tritrichomonas foetus]
MSGQLRYLVTGGAGFIGSHIVNQLMQQGCKVTVLDNFFTGSKSNIEHWIGNPNFTLIEGDVIDPIDVEVDRIFHLACPASPPHYMRDPIQTLETSFLGTRNMLHLAKKYNARLLYTSTSEVYGDPDQFHHPQKEEYWGNVNCRGPRACYDEGKRSAETYCFEFHRKYGTEIRTARLFNTYGPNMDPNDGRVVSNMIMQALQGKDLTIYGTGKQTRSFGYVEDTVRGLFALMESDYEHPVNIGNPTEFSILELAQLVQKKINTNVKIVFQEAATDDPQQRKPDITKAKTILHWEPKISLDEGLDRTIPYFRDFVEGRRKR